MALKDYAHWNEEAATMWWAEEGRFGSEPPDYDPDDYLPGQDDEDEDDDEDNVGPFDDATDDEPHVPEDAYLDQSYEDRIVGDEW